MAGVDPNGNARTLPRIGSYELLQPLGSGGMSSVFRARHVETGLEVAVKVLPRTLAKNPVVLQRFLREAKSAESLEHPNIVAIYDHGVDEGRHYLVLEFVPGGDLHDRVRADGPLPIAEAVAIVRAVAEGLRFAATRGLIHRDIKPANLLICPDGRVKIADLGLALQADDDDERVTREGTTVGTVDFMAPEQARDSRATSIRSDIYSLGCTTFFLLTGQPPFPGGDVAEKLNKHINAERPDPRVLRPDVPDKLARLLRTMLARKSEARFADYDELIAALDTLGTTDALPEPSVPDEPLVALFDDEAEEPGDLVPDDDYVLLTPAEPPAKRADAQAAAPMAMADLAELDDLDDDLVLPVSKPLRGKAPDPSPPVALFADEDDDDEGEVVEALGGTPPASIAPRRMSESERSWLTKLVLGGVGLILLVITIDQVNRATRTDTPEAAGTTVEESGEVGPSIPPPVPPVRGVDPSPNVRPPVVVAKPKAKVTAPQTPPAPPWVEPGDPPVDLVAEAAYGPGVEARFVPSWAAAAPTRPVGKLLTVRRLPDPADPDQKADLRAALDATAGVVEIADDGPYFEDTFRMVGDARVVRARPGYRAVVSLGRTRGDGASTESAFLELGKRSLTLERLDLIVDVAALSRTQTALISCRGGSLTLRDCTVTVVNKAATSFSLLRTEPADRPSHVLFERTFVRGLLSSVVEVQGGPAELAWVRSLVVNGQGVGVSFSGRPASGAADVRSAAFVRSVVVTRGPAFERFDTLPGLRPRPVGLRALGSTFAHFDIGLPGPLVATRGDTDQASDLLDWQGDDNTFEGWSQWLSAGAGRAAKVVGLSAARGVWKGTDAASVESPRRWPLLPPSPDRVSPDQVRPLAQNRLAVLSRIPIPKPWLNERTIEAFMRPTVPGSAVGARTPPSHGPAGGPGGPIAVLPPKFDDVGSQASLKSGMIGGFGQGGQIQGNTRYNPMGKVVTPGAGAQGSSVPVPGSKDLTFSTESAPYFGDLGRFLTDQAKPGLRLLRVKVVGSGRHPWTPVRLPEGVSLEVVVEADPDGRTPAWTAVRASAGERSSTSEARVSCCPA